MERIFILSLVFCLLSACVGGPSSDQCEKTYFDGSIGTCIPDGWVVLDKGALKQHGLPNEVTVAFQSETPLSGQFPSVTVTFEILRKALATDTYSDANIDAVKLLPAYEKISIKKETVDGRDSKIHIFTAQPIPDEPISRFYQLSAVSGGVGYTFTAALPVTVPKDIESEIMSILENVHFSEQLEE